MTKSDLIVLPAIRGIMGDWVYYSVLMSLGEIGKRLQYAQEIPQGKRELSKEIQRQVKKKRGKEIAEYIRTQPEYFFNSLVVAVYDGEPRWHAQKNISASEEYLNDLDEETIGSIGFLKFDGGEQLFAIDGQHRLAGIKALLKDDPENKSKDDKIPVIFVSHANTEQGLKRTRRLFTTLNKKAQKVSKDDIIMLDEDDVMAICTRWLIEKKIFKFENIILRVASNNMPSSNTSHFTTIGTLYDILTILFTKAGTKLQQSEKKLQDKRPPDNELDAYFELAKKYFDLLRQNFGEIDELFTATDTDAVVKKQRGKHGGNALFRPMGVEIFTLIIAALTVDKGMALEKAVEIAAKLPRDLNKPPYENIIWSPKAERILSDRKITLRETLLYMIDCSKMKRDNLEERYKAEKDDEKAELPDQIKY